MIQNNFILSSTFLQQLSEFQHREIFAKIISLNIDEKPIEEISGKISNGSLNIDGKSALRRTCSLTLVSNNVNITDFYWGVKTKFELYIGLTNYIDPTYPDIIWFKEGVFVITDFSVTRKVNSCSINISGKDKMCLLNGDVGGSINAISDFGKLEEYDAITNTTTFTPIKIKDIIREMVHAYGNESWHNIFINDLADQGIELLDYNYEKPLYLFVNGNDNMTVTSALLTGDFQVYPVNKDTTDKEHPWKYPQGILQVKQLDDLSRDELNPRLLNSNLIDTTKLHYFIPKEKFMPGAFPDGDSVCSIIKVEKNMTAGYRLTDLVFPTDLIANVGESITSVLDKIIKILGPFEYFYDTDGRFIFQRKPTFIGAPWTNLIVDFENQRHYVDSSNESKEIAYSFDDKNLIISFQNKPNFRSLKNDFSIWGEKTTPAGAKVPIHLRYALDKKPEKYISPWQNKTYYSMEFSKDPNPLEQWDWRELIYQMAIDYRKHNHDDDFLQKIAHANKENYPTGTTGYEQYYTDMEGFWRLLYAPQEEVLADPKEYSDFINSTQKTGNGIWNESILIAPESLIFWIDFLDSAGSISKYSVSSIGDRTKPVTDKDVKGIFFKEVPNVLFTTEIKEEDKVKYPGYTFIQLDQDKEELFHISSQGKSAKTTLDELMYAHLQNTDSISITSVPIYYLQPNQKISVYDEESHISGLYIIEKISISLSHQGTMSISAFKAPDRFL